MKIVHVISGLELGGAEIFLDQLIAAWPQSGDEHVVITFHGGEVANRLRVRNILVYEMRFQKSWDLISVERTMWSLWRKLGELRPDVVISALWSANVIARMLCFAKKLPLISILHNNAYFLSPFKRFLDLLVGCLFPGKQVAVAHLVADSYKAFPLLGSYFSRQLSVIENGIDVDAIVAQKNEHTFVWSGCFVFGAVGRLIPSKNFQQLIWGFGEYIEQQKAQNVPKKDLPVLCIVGDGPEFEELTHLVELLGLRDLVFLCGTQTRMDQIYHSFSVYVSVSLSEGLSLALLEAMAAGLPVVITKQSGANQFLATSQDGIVLENVEPGAIAQGLQDAQDNYAFYAQHSAERTAFIRKNYSIHRTARQYADLCERIAIRNS